MSEKMNSSYQPHKSGNGLSSIMGWMIALCALFGGALGIIDATKLIIIEDYSTIWMGLMAAITLIATPFTLVWWKQADEGVKEAHKSAWFWGGSLGFTLVLFIVALNRGLGLGLIEPFMEAFRFTNAPFEAGFYFTAVMMAIGYGIAWMIWWMRHR